MEGGIVDMVSRSPITCLLISLLVGIFLFINQFPFSLHALSFSYHDVLQHREGSRLFTSALLHQQLFHLLFNLNAFFSLGSLIEISSGASFFLTLLLFLLVSVPFFHLLLVFLLTRIRVYDFSFLETENSIGFSGVLFGLMSFEALSNYFSSSLTRTIPMLGGLVEVPLWAAPMGSLIITQVLVPKASLMGHLSGILTGFVLEIIWEITLKGKDYNTYSKEGGILVGICLVGVLIGSVGKIYKEYKRRENPLTASFV